MAIGLRTVFIGERSQKSQIGAVDASKLFGRMPAARHFPLPSISAGAAIHFTPGNAMNCFAFA